MQGLIRCDEWSCPYDQLADILVRRARHFAPPALCDTLFANVPGFSSTILWVSSQLGATVRRELHRGALQDGDDFGLILGAVRPVARVHSFHGSWPLYQIADELSRRLTSIFLCDKNGRRPVYGGAEKFQKDPNWRDYLLFYEYFHGDNGAGLGASHQTGRTGIIARGMHVFATSTAEQFLALGKAAAVTEVSEKARGAQAGE